MVFKLKNFSPALLLIVSFASWSACVSRPHFYLQYGHIPHSASHHYVNTASEPTLALAVYAPAFDGKDIHPVGLP